MKKRLFILAIVAVVLAGAGAALAGGTGGLADKIRLTKVEMVGKAYADQRLQLRLCCDTMDLDRVEVERSVARIHFEWTETSMDRPLGWPSEGGFHGPLNKEFRDGAFSIRPLFRFRGKYRAKFSLEFLDGSVTGPLMIEFNVI